MNAGRARLLRQHRDRRLDFALYGHHEVRHLIDDDDDVGYDLATIGRVFKPDIRMLDPLQRRALVHPLIEVLHVAATVRGEQLIALVHLHHSPFEHRGRVPIVGNDFVAKVGEPVINRKLHHLRIDHEEAKRPRRVAINQARDDRVHAHGFSGSRRARDEQVRHLREVGHHRLSLEIFA